MDFLSELQGVVGNTFHLLRIVILCWFFILQSHCITLGEPVNLSAPQNIKAGPTLLHRDVVEINHASVNFK